MFSPPDNYFFVVILQLDAYANDEAAYAEEEPKVW